MDKVELTSAANSWAPPPETPPPDQVAELSSFLNRALLMEAATARSIAAAALVDHIAGLVIKHEAPSRNRPRGAGELAKVNEAVAAIVGGVLAAWRHNPPRPVSQGLHNAALGAVPGGRTAAAATIEAMKAEGLLAFAPSIRFVKDHGFGLSTRSGRLARLWPTAALLQLATRHGIMPDSVKAALHPIQPTKAPKVVEPVRARGLKTFGQRAAEELPPTDLGPHLPKLASEVSGWNAHAEGQKVTGCRPPRWSRAFGPDALLGGRWTAAGAPNYQTMAPGDRLEHIRINGEEVVEADVKAAHLSIMHGLLGLELPLGDPYAIPGASDRDAVKAWIVATLGKGTAVTRWPKSKADQFKGTDAKALGRLICARYPFLERPAQAVAMAAGLTHLGHIAPPERLLTLRLQAIEAAAITGAMGAVRSRRGALAMPVHDSLIVPVSEAGFVAGALVGAFSYFAKVRVTVAPLRYRME